MSGKAKKSTVTETYGICWGCGAIMKSKPVRYRGHSYHEDCAEKARKESRAKSKSY